MTQVAIIGTFYTTLDKAKEGLFKKESQTKKTHAIIEYDKGFLVVPFKQLKLLES